MGVKNYLLYSHQRAVFTSSLSESSLLSLPACWTRFKSTSYNEDGSKTNNFLSNDSPSFLGKTKHEILKYLIDSFCIDRFYWRDQQLCKFVESWKKFTWGKSSFQRGIFFLYSNMAAVTSKRSLYALRPFISSSHEQMAIIGFDIMD